VKESIHHNFSVIKGSIRIITINIIAKDFIAPKISPNILSNIPSPTTDINEDSNLPKILIKMKKSIKIKTNEITFIACGLDTKLETERNNNGERYQPINIDPTQERIENKSFKKP